MTQSTWLHQHNTRTIVPSHRQNSAYIHYYDQTDTEAPTIAIDIITESVGTNDDLVVNWTANDNMYLDIAQIYYSSDSLQSLVFVDSVNAELGEYTFPIPDSTLTNFSTFIIHVYDAWGNSAADTSNFFSIYDNTPPNVNVLSPGEGFSVPEIVPFIVRWDHSDNIELSEHLFEYTSNGVDYDTLLETVYFTQMDSFYFDVGGVTNTAQIRLTVSDLAGNTATDLSEQFSVTDNTAPTVNLTAPVAGSIVGIGDALAITWNDSDNVGVKTISLYYNTSGDWVSITENAANENEYDWIIPNEPTDNLQVRLIGQDAVGLSDTSEVGGITIEISYPMVTNVSPASGSIDFRTNEFYFNFSQRLDVSTVTSDNVQFESEHSTDLAPTLTYVDSTTSINVSFDNNIISMDSISVTLTEQLTNVFGYALDGDGDGEGGDNYTTVYQTSMLADYDGDMAISVEDLSQFDQLLVILEIAGSPAIDPIMDIGRAGHQSEIDTVAADLDAVRSISGSKRKTFRCL